MCIDNNNPELAVFANTVLSLLYKHAPIKRKFICGNNSTFMTKDLRAGIMLRYKLTQIFYRRELMNLNNSEIGKQAFVSSSCKKRKGNTLSN